MTRNKQARRSHQQIAQDSGVGFSFAGFQAPPACLTLSANGLRFLWGIKDPGALRLYSVLLFAVQAAPLKNTGEYDDIIEISPEVVMNGGLMFGYANIPGTGLTEDEISAARRYLIENGLVRFTAFTAPGKDTYKLGG